MLGKKIHIIIMCLAICLSLVSGVSAAPGGQYSEASVISAGGFGKVTASPDVAHIRIGVETTGMEARAAQAENDNIMTTVLNAIKALGISDNDIKTTFLDLTPVYNYPDGKPAELVSYNATNYITVRVEELTKAGEVIDSALSHGANRIDSLSFDVKKPEELRKAALREAVRDARTKADVLADALGVRITGVKLVTENVGSVTTRDNLLLAKNSRDMVSSNIISTPLEAGAIDVTATVHVDYIIE